MSHSRPDPGARLLADLAVVLGVFVIVGLLAGALWRWVTPLPYALRTAGALVTDQRQLAVRGETDLYYVVISFVAALLTGLALVWWRSRDEVVTVLAGTVASLLAGALAAATGHLLGPEPVLPHARQVPPGTHVSEPLALAGHAAVAVWPLGFLVAAVTLLWTSSGRDRSRRGDDPEPAYTGDHLVGQGRGD